MSSLANRNTRSYENKIRRNGKRCEKLTRRTNTTARVTVAKRMILPDQVDLKVFH